MVLRKHLKFSRKKKEGKERKRDTEQGEREMERRRKGNTG